MNNSNRPQDVAQSIASNRPAGQVASIVRQLETLYSKGMYHAYPLPEDDPFRLVVLQRWDRETEHGTQG